MYFCSEFVDWLEKRQLPCFYKSVLGTECPGCGMQRAFIALLRGNLQESLQLYPALIPLVIMFAVLVVHIFYHLKHGAKILTGLFIFNTAIIVVSYICKLIN